MSDRDVHAHLDTLEIKAVILALICLETLCKEHPSVVRRIAAANGDPELVDSMALLGPLAIRLRRSLLGEG